MTYQEALLGNDKALRWLLKKGLSLGAIRGNNLGWRSKSNTDPYSERILFPVYDLAGKFVTYQGRILEAADKSVPKYWHRTFDKSSNFEGLYNCLPYVLETRRCVLVEGPTDRIILNQLGFPAAAILGSAVSPLQAAIIAALCDEVYIMFDNDEAGDNAYKMAKELLEPYECSTKRVKFKHAKDPSESFERRGDYTSIIQALERRGCPRHPYAVY